MWNFYFPQIQLSKKDWAKFSCNFYHFWIFSAWAFVSYSKPIFYLFLFYHSALFDTILAIEENPPNRGIVEIGLEDFFLVDYIYEVHEYQKRILSNIHMFYIVMRPFFFQESYTF